MKYQNQITLNHKLKTKFEYLKLLMPKFLNICIFNFNALSKILNLSNKSLTKKLFELVQIFYLNEIIDDENLINIIRLKIISCLCKENNIEYSDELLEIQNKPILNISPLETIIKFLLSFKSIEMNKKKLSSFINIINKTM